MAARNATNWAKVTLSALHGDPTTVNSLNEDAQTDAITQENRHR
jgi:hypothetical protein